MGEAAKFEVLLYMVDAKNGEEDQTQWAVTLTTRVPMTWKQFLDTVDDVSTDKKKGSYIRLLWHAPTTPSTPMLDYKGRLDMFMTWYDGYTHHEGVAAMRHHCVGEGTRPIKEESLLRLIKLSMGHLWQVAGRPRLPHNLHDILVNLKL